MSLALSLLRLTKAKYVLVSFFIIFLTQPIFVAVKTAKDSYTLELALDPKYRHLEQMSFAQLSHA